MKVWTITQLACLGTCVVMTSQPAAAAEDELSRRWEREIRLRMGPQHERLAARAELAPVTVGELEAIDFGLDLSPGMLQDAAPSEDSDQQPAAGHSDLASAATNPVAPLIQLQFQNTMVGESNAGDGFSNVFTFQPVIPWKIGKQAMLSRITLPLLVATPDLGDPIGREYGLGDTIALNFAIWNIDKGGPWQGMIGPGVTFTFPTATSDFTGEGKWQAGPGLVYFNTASKRIQWGALAYQQWSYASTGGDNGRPEVSKLFFQPIFVVHFDKGWYVGTRDILWSIDWNDNARWSLPIGVRVGRVTKFGQQPINIFVEPFYDVSGNNLGNEWGVKLNLTLLFPE